MLNANPPIKFAMKGAGVGTRDGGVEGTKTGKGKHRRQHRVNQSK